MTFTPGLAVFAAIRADRVEEFEEWSRTVLDLEDLRGRWRLLRTDERRGDAVVYVSLLGSADPDEWDIEAALRRAYGPERAQAELVRFESMMDGEQTLLRLTPIV